MLLFLFPEHDTLFRYWAGGYTSCIAVNNVTVLYTVYAIILSYFPVTVIQPCSRKYLLCDYLNIYPYLLCFWFLNLVSLLAQILCLRPIWCLHQTSTLQKLLDLNVLDSAQRLFWNFLSIYIMVDQLLKISLCIMYWNDKIHASWKGNRTMHQCGYL